jgi:hypothetical protein
MILGWTTHEKLVSPYYMKTIKPSPSRMVVKFFFPHLRFLLSYHRYKKNKKDFLKGKTERDDAPSILLGEVLYDILS